MKLRVSNPDKAEGYELPSDDEIERVHSYPLDDWDVQLEAHLYEIAGDQTDLELAIRSSSDGWGVHYVGSLSDLLADRVKDWRDPAEGTRQTIVALEREIERLKVKEADRLASPRRDWLRVA